MNEIASPEVLSALKQEIRASLHCALPGIVESYDAETGFSNQSWSGCGAVSAFAGCTCIHSGLGNKQLDGFGRRFLSVDLFGCLHRWMV